MSDQKSRSNFFMRLNFDVRQEIYKHLDFPPFNNGDEVSGFVLSCKQAHDEAVAASESRLRKTLLDAHKSVFKDHQEYTLILPDASTLRRFSDIRSLTINLPYDYAMAADGPEDIFSHEDSIYFGFLLPLLDLPFKKMTVVFRKTPSYAGPGDIIAPLAHRIWKYMGSTYSYKHWTQIVMKHEADPGDARVEEVAIFWDLQKGEAADKGVEVCYNEPALMEGSTPGWWHKGGIHELERDDEDGHVVIRNSVGAVIMWCNKPRPGRVNRWQVGLW